MLVSVVIPMFNAENTIIDSLNSVKNQTYNNVEVIIVNDGSTDDSFKKVERYIELNLLNNFILLDKLNGGVSSARNLGLKKAKGDYISLLDSDDIWFEEKIEKQISFFIDYPQFDFQGSLIKSNNQFFDSKYKEITLSMLINKNYFQPSTVIFDKKILNDVGYFDENQTHAEEGNYFMRIASKYRCALYNEQLIVYGNGKEGFGVSGLSSNLREMERGELINLRFAYNNNYIGFFRYVISVIFSILKYIRRIIIVRFRNL